MRRRARCRLLCEISRDTPPALLTLPSGDVLLSKDNTSRFLGALPRGIISPSTVHYAGHLLYARQWSCGQATQLSLTMSKVKSSYLYYWWQQLPMASRIDNTDAAAAAEP